MRAAATVLVAFALAACSRDTPGSRPSASTAEAVSAVPDPAALPLAAAGLLNPAIAGASMGLSSVFVVSNSLRLRRFRSAVLPAS